MDREVDTMSQRDPVEKFKEFNRLFARRSPELLRFKVARMAEGPFAFFRGTFHLFADDLLAGAAGTLPLLQGTGAELELIGDIHSENYGTFKADDGVVHYDVNDFDETTTGRFDLDVCRLATSHLLAAQERKDPLTRAVQAALAGLLVYAETVVRLLGKHRNHEPDVSESRASGCGPIDDLVRHLAAAKRAAFIGGLTQPAGGKRTIVRAARSYNLADDQRAQAVRLLADYRQRLTDPPGRDDYFTVEDACGRVSGIGSMGRLRYVLLLTGKGSADARNVLLEFKESRPSAYDLARGRDKAPEALAGRAEKVIRMQRQSQAAANRFLGWAVDGGQSFQVRQLGPHDERVDLKSFKGQGLDGLARVQAEVLARIHARSAARAVGPANPLAELADPEAFCQRVLAFALGYADVARRDWVRFVGARAELERVEEWMAG
jgi:uncharacterized protein (DUF2252 family)